MQRKELAALLERLLNHDARSVLPISREVLTQIVAALRDSRIVLPTGPIDPRSEHSAPPPFSPDECRPYNGSGF